MAETFDAVEEIGNVVTNAAIVAARGVGQIGLAGVAPAITATVYHAIGVRARKLPVRIEDLLKSDIREA